MTKRKGAAPDVSDDEISAARSLLHESHLSHSSAEDSFTEFEFALHHITEAFARWSSALHEHVSGELLPVGDVSVLQLIRMNERPKSAAEIGRFLNRDDSSNILYALRKLDKAGLIRKSGGPSRQTTYQVTDRGREVTDRYAELRKELLLPAIARMGGEGEQVADLTQLMWHLAGLYEQAARTTAMVRMLKPDRAQPVSAAKPAARRPRKPRGDAAEAA